MLETVKSNSIDNTRQLSLVLLALVSIGSSLFAHVYSEVPSSSVEEWTSARITSVTSLVSLGILMADIRSYVKSRFFLGFSGWFSSFIHPVYTHI